MAEKVKLNKNSLREQNQALKLYMEFLPTLELRKQQLQTEVRAAKKEIDDAEAEFAKLLASVESWKGRLDTLSGEIVELIKVNEVVAETINVAGVKVPNFIEVKFDVKPYSFIATPWLMDDAVEFFKNAISSKEAVKILRKKYEIINKELTKTAQRINLYEKVLIPQTKENIRKIKVYLGDQQTAAVCRAKIAKTKILKKVLEKAKSANN